VFRKEKNIRKTKTLYVWEPLLEFSQRAPLKIEMDNCIEAILQSVAGCKSKTAKLKDNDRALL